MKMVYAIVRDEDGNRVMSKLNKCGFSVTKLATTGGFLRSGNTTLISGVEDDKVDDAINVIKKECETRKQVVVTSSPMVGIGNYTSIPVTVDVGGATIFVMDIEKFEKI
jgi:Uncharacterized protein conserved in bacteria